MPKAKLKRGDRLTNWDQLRRGDVYTCNGDRPHIVTWDPEPERISSLDNQIFQGHAKAVEIPGLTQDGGAYLFRGTLYIGCQRIVADGAFRALGKALGYEVTP